jgi:alkylation response protein AidB-like acyl-CoA dehydrogenase
VCVPEEQTVLPFDAVADHDGPLWRLPFMGLLGVCLFGVPLGIGRRALDEVVALAPNRTTPGSLTPISADPLVQQRIGRAIAGLDSARAYLDDALGSVWTSALAGDEPSFEQRTRLHVALLTALDAGTAAADTAFALGGSRAVLDGSAIQRCFRDAHTIGQHAAFRSDSYGDWARDRLGAAGS